MTIFDDLAREGTETFFLQIYQPSGAAIDDAYGQATILDDDGDPPFFTIADAPTVPEGNSTAENRQLVFPVQLSGTPTGTVTVKYATMGEYFDSTAGSGVDYVAQEGTLTFPLGTTTRDIAIDIVEDTAIEPNEWFYVQIYDASGATFAAERYGLGLIGNDDP